MTNNSGMGFKNLIQLGFSLILCSAQDLFKELYVTLIVYLYFTG